MAVCCIVNKICDCHDLSSKSANMQQKKKADPCHFFNETKN